MKLKLLFFPLALIIAVWLSIWVIKPEIFAIKDKMKILELKENDLENIIKKEKTINFLTDSLDSNAGKEKAITDFLPASREEEEIINKIYRRSVDSGVILSRLSVSESDAKGDVKNIAAEAGDSPSSKAVMAAPVNVRAINAQVGIVGTYDQIRKFFGYVHSMEKLNNIHSVSIVQSASREGGSESASKVTGYLAANMALDFSFFSPVQVDKNEDLPIFSKQGFNFEIADRLDKLLSEKVSPVTTGITGKKNPFTP